MIQPELLPVNGADACLHACYDKNADGETVIKISWGLCLLMTVRPDKELFEFRVIVGLLYNLKYNLARLEEFFNVSAKTIRRWGRFMTKGSSDQLIAVFLGANGLKKLSSDALSYVKARYLEIRNIAKNYREIIADEVMRYFGKEVSSEFLRQIFRSAEEEIAKSDADENQVVYSPNTAVLPSAAVSLNASVDDELKPESPLENESPCVENSSSGNKSSDDKTAMSSFSPSAPEVSPSSAAFAENDSASLINPIRCQIKNDSAGDAQNAHLVEAKIPSSRNPAPSFNSLFELGFAAEEPPKRDEGCENSQNQETKTLLLLSTQPPAETRSLESADGENDLHISNSEMPSPRNPAPSFNSPFEPKFAAEEPPKRDDGCETGQYCEAENIPQASCSLSKITRSEAAGEARSHLSALPPFAASDNTLISPNWAERLELGLHFTHHAGLLLLVQIAEEPLQNFPFIVRQLFWQTLGGAVCHEQGKQINQNGIEILTEHFVKNIPYQRKLTCEAASSELVNSIYEMNAWLISAGESRYFYFDPHTEVYSGAMKVLRDWCGALKGVSKCIHMDFIHTEFGQPCFTRHMDGCNDMRDRFHLCSNLFKRDILKMPHDASLTWVIDRGIWGRATLNTIAGNGDQFITWEKDYKKNQWDSPYEKQGYFQKEKRKNSSSGKPTVYCFEWRSMPWENVPAGWKIIVRAKKLDKSPIEVSIVTNCRHLSCEEIIWAIFNRWLQENDFKYLRTHFGIGMLVEKSFVSYEQLKDSEEDRMIESRAVKTLKKSKKKIEGILSGILLKLYRKFKRVPDTALLDQQKTQMINELKSLRNQIDEMNDEKQASRLLNSTKTAIAHSAKLINAETMAKTKNQLNERVRELEENLNAIDIELNEIPHMESRLQALAEEQYFKPIFRSRALADAIKIWARNIFGIHHSQFRHAYDNYREDHVMFRVLIQSPGVLLKTAEGIIAKIFPKLSLPKSDYLKIVKFVESASYFAQGEKTIQIKFGAPKYDESDIQVIETLMTKTRE